MLNEGPKTPKPQEFAETVAQSNGYELAAAQCALGQSRDPQVRSFAEHMIAEHQQMAQALREAAQASRLPAPMSQVGADQARLLMSLQSLRGVEFDREYGRQQKLVHTSALAVMRSYADKGSDQNLRRMAASSVPVIERHLQSAASLPQP